VAAADESGQSSGLRPVMDSTSNANTSLDGVLSPPMNVDERPIGACYNEMQAVKDAVNAMRAADARAKAALAAFWACRNAASATNAAANPAPIRSQFLATTFDGREDDVQQIERLIDDDSKTS